MAIYISHKLVLSARLNMKVASWGYCVLVFDSSGEPATHPGHSSAVVPDFSGSEFEVGRISSCDDVATRDERSPMGCRSSLYQFFLFIFGQCSGQLITFDIL